MTTTGTEAYEAIRAHHQELDEQLTARADAVSIAVTAGRPYEVAVAAFIAYLAEEVLPHALAEEKTIYPVAATRADLGGMVGEMIAEHVYLSAAASRLAVLTDGAGALEQAQQIAGHFAAHAAKENDVLLPALLADGSVDLSGLLDDMHHHAGHAGTQPPADESHDGDAEATVLSRLLEATSALARAGDTDRAARIAASAWAALHKTRPDLAARVTAALHGLVREAGAKAPGGTPEGDGGRSPAADPDLDVRDLPPAQRHVTIFDAYDALLPGTGFVLVNDHDPKPLGYQFQAEYAGEFTWDYLESGPAVWRVRIGRAAA